MGVRSMGLNKRLLNPEFVLHDQALICTEGMGLRHGLRAAYPSGGHCRT